MSGRIAMIVLKATEARLEALKHQSVKYTLSDGREALLLEHVEKIRADLFVAILDLEHAA
jgi:hypothetical protein